MATPTPPQQQLPLRISEEDLAPARGTPARCVGAVLRGRVILAQSAGDAGGGAACSVDDTLFAAASISKLITAVLVLQCAERGELSLDEDVNARLPVACRARHPDHPAAPLTPRMLLQHRGGLCDDESALHVGPWRTAGGDCPATLEAYISARFAAAADDAAALWHLLPPGEAPYHYSNLGMTLLALFIQVSVGGGASVASLAQERVFAPLHMTRTAFLLSDAHAFVAADRARGCAGVALAAPHDASGAPLAPYGVAEWPAAGLRTTLSDLLRFAAQFTCEPQACTILRPESLHAMLPVSCTSGLAWWGRDATYGEQERTCDVWAHGGFMQGVRSHLYLFPRQRLALALLQNGEACYEDAVAAVEAAVAEAAEALDLEGALSLRDILT
jgi:CubicO group peptidase (beta-lactamase class C family)